VTTNEALSGPNRDLKALLIEEALATVDAPLDRLDLKMITSALRELRTAFATFGPYRSQRKVTVFGSARTQPGEPAYDLAYELGARLAAAGWMVITGGGPGIMEAAARGAGPDHAFGVNIRLPLEQPGDHNLAANGRLIEMKYFFTRKVLMIRESDAFVSLPGGLGTLDETFELLTLMQTGKAQLAPLVLLEPHGSDYWSGLWDLLEARIVARGLADEEDLTLLRRADDVTVALEEILGFYRLFHSLRVVGQDLVLRLLHPLPSERLAELQERFGDISLDGRLRAIPPTPWELREGDHPELARLALRFDRRSFGRLRQLIDAINATDTKDVRARA
jgi:uncharacterized protein (TIGR00730 family)